MRENNDDYRAMYDRKYVGAWDLSGKDVTVKIVRVVAEELQNRQGKNKKPVVYFDGTDKGFALNKTNGQIIASMYGPRTRDWVGKCITIYPTQVSFGRDQVDAIRVRPGIPKDKKANGIKSQPVDPEMREKQNAAAALAELETISPDEGP